MNTMIAAGSGKSQEQYALGYPSIYVPPRAIYGVQCLISESIEGVNEKLKLLSRMKTNK